MMNNDTIHGKKGYAITYKVIHLYGDYVLYLPCGVIKGKICTGDLLGSFVDNNGELYYSCDTYEFITQEGVSIFYANAITNFKLNERYPDLSNINDKVYEYKEEKSSDILLGYINYSKNCIDLINIPFDMIVNLSNNVDYQIEGKDTTVTLNKIFLKKLLNENSLERLKDKLQEYYKGIKKIERLHKQEGINSMSVREYDNTEISFEYGDNGMEEFLDYSTDGQENKATQYKDLTFDEKRELYKKVDSYIKDRMIGQEQARDDIVTLIISNLCTQNRYNLTRALLVGPTGCGKTLICRLIEECIGIKVTEFDCNSLTQEGYVGKSINDIFKSIYYNCNEDIELAQNSILILDEFDKLADRGADVSDVGVQKSLLKLLDGGKFDVDLDKRFGKTVTFDTSKLIILACGAFQDIRKKKTTVQGFNGSSLVNDDTNDFVSNPLKTEEFIKYGIIPETIARFSYIIPFSKITVEQFMDMLKTSLISPLRIKEDKFINDYGIQLEYDDGYLREVVNSANEQGVNARGLNIVVNKSLLDIEHYVLMHDENYERVIVNKDTVNNPKQYKLVKKK